MKQLTVGHIRSLIKGVSDDAIIFPDWAGDPPGDNEPAVSIKDICLNEWEGQVAISILVELVYLDEMEDVPSAGKDFDDGSE